MSFKDCETCIHFPTPSEWFIQQEHTCKMGHRMRFRMPPNDLSDNWGYNKPGCNDRRCEAPEPTTKP